MPTKANHRPLSTAEVCDLFQISRSTLFRWENKPGVRPSRDRRAQRQYGPEALAAIRERCITSWVEGSRDLDTMATALEHLFLAKMHSNELVGLVELRELARATPLAPTTVKKLLGFAMERLDPDDQEFELILTTLLESCQRRRELLSQERP